MKESWTFLNFLLMLKYHILHLFLEIAQYNNVISSQELFICYTAIIINELHKQIFFYQYKIVKLERRY